MPFSRLSPETTSEGSKLREVIAGLADCHVVVNRSWQFVSINAAAERQIYHRPAAELLGKVVWEIYPAAIGNDLYRLYHEAMEQTRPVHGEGYSVFNSWFEVHALPCRDGLELKRMPGELPH